jgi:hypothetical protein
MRWFPILPENTPSDPQSRHLVSTGKFYDSKIMLFIHTEGDETKPHLCYAFCLESYSPIVSFDEYSPSPDTICMEHGWFQDPNLFVTICLNRVVTNQYAPGQTTEQAEQAFVNWRTSLLTTLETNHGALWVPVPTLAAT